MSDFICADAEAENERGGGCYFMKFELKDMVPLKTRGGVVKAAAKWRDSSEILQVESRRET
jgi:hypothetical protein